MSNDEAISADSLAALIPPRSGNDKPCRMGDGLKLNITEHDNALDLGLAWEVADYFRVSKNKAEDIIDTAFMR